MGFSAAAAAMAVGSVASAAMQSGAASDAAQTQANAADRASANQLAMYGQTRSDLAPYRNIGVASGNVLANMMGLGSNVAAPQTSFDQAGFDSAMASYNAAHQAWQQSGGGTYQTILAGEGDGVNQYVQQFVPAPEPTPPDRSQFTHTVVPDSAELVSSGAPSTGNGTDGSAGSLLKIPDLSQSWLESTPGYQFALSQGLKSVQNSAAARGLGISGAAMRGAADYATGLANNTYETQFQNALEGQDAQFNRLMGLTQLGQNSAAQTGALGVQSTSAANNYLTGGAAASAAGQVGSANAIAGGLNNAIGGVTNLYMMNALMKNMNGGTGAGLFG